MRGRTFRIALLVFQAVWLNAVLPGHTRGIVPLPGNDRRAPEHVACSDSCCPMADGEHHPNRREHKRGDPAANCALCHFAARVTPAVPIDLAPPPLARLGPAPEPIDPFVVSLPFHPTYDGRAPPADA